MPQSAGIDRGLGVEDPGDLYRLTKEQSYCSTALPRSPRRTARPHRREQKRPQLGRFLYRSHPAVGEATADLLAAEFGSLGYCGVRPRELMRVEAWAEHGARGAYVLQGAGRELVASWSPGVRAQRSRRRARVRSPARPLSSRDDGDDEPTRRRGFGSQAGRQGCSA